MLNRQRVRDASRLLPALVSPRDLPKVLPVSGQELSPHLLSFLTSPSNYPHQ